MSDKDLNSRELLVGVASGNSEAANVVFNRYIERLIALVQKRIGRKLRRRIDADDVVQSTYRSFFVHAKLGEYTLVGVGDLWRLLASIAIHKLYGQIERHTAARRTIAREDPIDHWAAGAATPEPTAAEAVAITEQLQLTSKRLTADQRAALIAYLQGDSVESIAAALNKSARTIRRILAEVRQEFENELLARADRNSFIEDKARHQFDARASVTYADFTLDRLIGIGGMGKVYRAKHRETGQLVAIKTLHKSQLHDQAVVESFLEETEILATLHHPSIVGFRGVGRFPGGSYFMVMEFIDGGSLQSRLTRGPIPVVEAVRILRNVAEAIGYSHAHGIVHGDLKPGNILIDSTNRVVVSDFGLAQFVESSLRRPRRLIGGTAGYLAPEVVNEGRLPAPAADIYALGALLSSLIADVNGLSQTVTRKASERILSVCQKCLAIDPQSRFATADCLVAELRGIEAELLAREEEV